MRSRYRFRRKPYRRQRRRPKEEELAAFRNRLSEKAREPMTTEELKAKYIALFHKDKKVQRDRKSDSQTSGSQPS